MLSDESSSDSETGRFKCRTKTQDDQSKSNRKEEHFRSSARSRPSDSDRFRRELERPNRDDKDRHDRYPRDRNRFSRHSPPRRRSRERSSGHRSYERHKHSRNIREGSKPTRRSTSKDRRRSTSKERKRSTSKDRKRDSRSRSRRSPEHRKDLREEIKTNISQEKSEEESSTKPREKVTVLPEQRGKRSEIYVPPPMKANKSKSKSPIVVERQSDSSEEVQPGSYYSMIPAVIKDKSEESSEIDSSDDEKLRAKLLNLEKELHKTKKKKHRRKHKKKHSRSKDREPDPPTVVEVSSTTDIQDNVKNEEHSQPDVVEVSSTQKNVHKESGEEGEIISDDDSQSQYEIDPNDLRHKLKRSIGKSQIKTEVCGPALPPHFEKQKSRKSPAIEGPALPPHLQKKPKHIGPSIPDNMRRVLSENVSTYESPDEDDGIGPLPAGSEEKWSEAHQRLEERALDMKIRKLDGHSLHKSDVKSREEWMLKLPEGKAKYLGLEARSFRAKEGPDMSDRSSWTDTPEEKARKLAGIPKEEDMDAALRRDARSRQIANRDDEQEDAVKKHKKKHRRDTGSLLEMHERKLKKKKKKEEKDEDKKERRPFSRDVDLQVNRFDEAQKRSIIKKAQGLDTRFSRGEAKYL